MPPQNENIPPKTETLYKSVTIASVVLLFFYAFFFSRPANPSSDILSFKPKWPASLNGATANSPTNLSHIGFLIVSSLNTWKQRRAYVESWWRPNVTRGYVFLDQEPTEEFLPWPSTSPPFRVSDDVTKLRIYPELRNPGQVRLVRSILDMYKLGDEGLRWFMMCDDDTLVFVDNLLEVLGKYDHTKYLYIGGNSESVKSNADFSFDMGFGGAGYALSYPLVEALSNSLDACIERYPYLFVCDHMAQSCLADLRVALTIEKGIHQIDLHGDISGLLSAHPQSPLLTLHHFDCVDPIFPSKDRYESARHLMKAGKFDQSRSLQQTICYLRENSWSFSVSWGYSAHVYESIIPRSILRKPLETFKPWAGNAQPPFFMFNTRWLTDNPCEAPHALFFESMEYTSGDQILATYVRASPRNLPPCSATGNHSADVLSKIRVFSPANTSLQAGAVECCDIEHKAESDVTSIIIRSCMKDEVIA